MRYLLTILLLWGCKAHALVILQYHHISEDTPKATSTSPELFARHLQWIKESGFNVATLDSLIPLIREGKALPGNTVLITFDDSYPSIFENALPVLKKYQYPFVVFANTAPVNSQHSSFMSWRQLKELTRFKGSIANHTANHVHMLRPLKDESNSEWLSRMRKEIEDAERSIVEQIGHNYKVLAYPYGEFNLALQSLLKDMGYIGVGQHSGPVPKGETLSIPRFPMGGNYGKKQDFMQKLRTLPFENYEIALYLEGESQPFNPLLPAGERSPAVDFKLGDADLLKRVKCYLSPGGETQKKQLNQNNLRFRAEASLPLGRSRYNCTAPAAHGQYYWLSIPFITRGEDGGWAAE